MEEREFRLLLAFFKALADENRLKIVGLLAQQEYRVSDLAKTLTLTEPTVSHHLNKLRQLGIVNLRTEGTNHYYRLNTAALAQMNRYLSELPQINQQTLLDDQSWIDVLEMEDWEKQVMKAYFRNKQLVQIPTKQKKFMVIVRWMATQFEAGRTYTEREINEIIQQYHPDYAIFRRALVDYRYLLRERDGSVYWVVETDRASVSETR